MGNSIVESTVARDPLDITGAVNELAAKNQEDFDQVLQSDLRAQQMERDIREGFAASLSAFDERLQDDVRRVYGDIEDRAALADSYSMMGREVRRSALAGNRTALGKTLAQVARPEVRYEELAAPGTFSAATR